MITYTTDIEPVVKGKLDKYIELGFNLPLATVLNRLKEVITTSNSRNNRKISLEKLIKVAIEIEIINYIQKTHDLEWQKNFINLYLKFISTIAFSNAFDIDYAIIEDVYHHLVCETILHLYKFDCNKNNAFSSYLRVSLNFIAKDYIAKIRCPLSVNKGITQAIQKLNTINEKFYKSHGYNPSIEVIVAMSGYSSNTIRKIRSFQSIGYTSLQHDIRKKNGEETNSSFSDIIADEVQEEIDQQVTSSLDGELLNQIGQLLISILSPEEIELFIERCIHINIGMEKLNKLLCLKQKKIRSTQALEQQMYSIIAKIFYQMYKGTSDIAQCILSFTTNHFSLYEMSNITHSQKKIQQRTITDDERKKMLEFFNQEDTYRPVDKMTDEEMLIIGLKLGIIDGTPLQTKEIEALTGISKELCVVVCEANDIYNGHVKKIKRPEVGKKDKD